MKRTLTAIAVGMTVFAITPATADAAPGRSSVILIDKKDFAGDAVAEGLAGRGCHNVSQDNMATSVMPYGKVTLWENRNCKGRKLVLKGNVADLGEFKFDNTTSSVSFS
ncbi:beta/gamma crystallin family protein [Lentzea tibetensis]|uniref:Beta/gamma crystallin family protein n=1 Tax=Lentzea tibetensis TaxID=2591470 RepID=A0A563ETX4_9PSEU|nr:beta/gamma crystallin family protein [Lentzea tibetensis]TWP51139.1 beta/gamma crystallin family protein [Lentzea tibetensis]